MKPHHSRNLVITWTPSVTSDRRLFWESSNPNVVSVDQNGRITARGVGSATIRAITANDVSAYVSVRVEHPKSPVHNLCIGDGTSPFNVPPLPQSVSITNRPASNRMTAGALHDRLRVTVEPTGANTNVVWSSDNTNIAIVNSLGIITAHRAGTTRITARTVNGQTATFQLTVVNPTAMTITNRPSSNRMEPMTVHDSLRVTFTPTNVTQQITWTSSNQNVAFVYDGLILAVFEGQTTITARSASGQVDSFILTVRTPSIPWWQRGLNVFISIGYFALSAYLAFKTLGASLFVQLALGAGAIACYFIGYELLFSGLTGDPVGDWAMMLAYGCAAAILLYFALKIGCQVLKDRALKKMAQAAARSGGQAGQAASNAGSQAGQAAGNGFPIREAQNLTQQLALQQVSTNPSAGHVIDIVLRDPRFPAAEGWQKLQQIVTTSNGRIVIHYVYNSITEVAADFKITQIIPIP